MTQAKIDVDTCPVSYGRTNCYFKDPKNPAAELESHDQVGLKMNNTSQFWLYFENILKSVFHESK